MVYDDPNSKGPVASLDFVNKSLAYVKDKIPAEKLSLGVPLYYWKWNLDSSKRIGSGMYKSVLAIMQNVRHVLGFDKDLGVAWISYVYNNQKYAVWFENKQSFEQKLNITKDNNLRGFSAWLLGGEDPGIWSLLGK
jgi:spore germination protein YaaH